MVVPEKQNGYTFKLDIEKFYQYIQDGDGMFKTETDSKGSKVSQAAVADEDLQKLIGLYQISDEQRDSEYAFVPLEYDSSIVGGFTLEQDSIEDLFERVKVCLYKKGEPVLSDKYEGKFVEINWLKALGDGDEIDEAYKEKLESCELAKTKEIYIDWL